MKLIQLGLLMVLMPMLSSVHAFEGEKIRFFNMGQKEHPVTIEYDGKTFTPPMETLTDKKISDPEYARFKEFFRNFVEQSRVGDRDSLLSVWHPQERSEIVKRLDDETMENNTGIAKSTTSMKLKMIIQYGDDYICLLEHSIFGRDPYVIKYGLTDYKGKLYFTSTIEKDYFYQIISHYLDKQNYISLLPK